MDQARVNRDRDLGRRDASCKEGATQDRTNLDPEKPVQGTVFPTKQHFAGRLQSMKYTTRSTRRATAQTMTDKEEANAGLEKVTDFHAEKELNEDDTANALSSLATNSAKTTR